VWLPWFAAPQHGDVFNVVTGSVVSTFPASQSGADAVATPALIVLLLLAAVAIAGQLVIGRPVTGVVAIISVLGAAALVLASLLHPPSVLPGAKTTPDHARVLTAGWLVFAGWTFEAAWTCSLLFGNRQTGHA
jgi:hypothetical protein